MNASDVLHHHLIAFGAGDTDAVLEDYTEESVLVTPNGTRAGLAELREAFDNMFAGLFKPGTYEFVLDGERVHEEVAMIWWHATCQNAAIPFGTDTFIVRDGKIARQTFAAQITPT
ncbi:MAG: nuclear transport factor 2 family protein [Thermoleophilia bacterium]